MVLSPCWRPARGRANPDASYRIEFMRVGEMPESYPPDPAIKLDSHFSGNQKVWGNTSMTTIAGSSRPHANGGGSPILRHWAGPGFGIVQIIVGALAIGFAFTRPLPPLSARRPAPHCRSGLDTPPSAANNASTTLSAGADCCGKRHPPRFLTVTTRWPPVATRHRGSIAESSHRHPPRLRYARRRSIGWFGHYSPRREQSPSLRSA